MIKWKDSVKESGLIILTISNELSFQSLQPVLEKAEMLESTYVHGFKRFTDLSNVTDLSLTSDEIWNISQRRAMMYTGPTVKSAIYSSDKLMFGMSRIYSAMMDPSPIEVEVFDDMEECADWLGLSYEALQSDTRQFETLSA